MLRRLIGLGALMILLAGCGDGVSSTPDEVGAGDVEDVTDDPEATADFLARSAESTQEVDSGRLEVTVETGDGFLPPTSMTGEFADDGQSAHMSVDAGPVQTEVTVVDGVVYTETAGQCFEVPVPEGAEGAPQGAVTDPGPLLDLLGGVGSGVTEEGREEIRGVETTHFAGSFTLQDALGELSEEDRATVEGLFGTAAIPDDFGDTEFPVDVYVGDDGLVRRMEMSLDYSGLSGEDEVPVVDIAYDLFDLGADITIEPPADCEGEAPPSILGPEGDGAFDPDEFRELCEDFFDDEAATEPFPEGLDPCALAEEGGTVGS